jgi:uncharacterized protein
MKTFLTMIGSVLAVLILNEAIMRAWKWWRKLRSPFQLWSQTWTGKRFYFDNPQPDQVCIEDIAHCLSNLCRFTGNVDRFYSVGQHCLLISDELRRRGYDKTTQLWGLLHDSSEAYMNDLSRCLKRTPGMEGYRQLEGVVMKVICRKFGLCPIEPPVVKELDIRMVTTEHRDLFTNFVPWTEFYDEKPFDFHVHPLPSTAIEKEFLRRFDELTK